MVPIIPLAEPYTVPGRRRPRVSWRLQGGEGFQSRARSGRSRPAESAPEPCAKAPEGPHPRSEDRYWEKGLHPPTGVGLQRLAPTEPETIAHVSTRPRQRSGDFTVGKNRASSSPEESDNPGPVLCCVWYLVDMQRDGVKRPTNKK